MVATRPFGGAGNLVMALSIKAKMLTTAVAFTVTGCANQPFRAAVARFGAQTDVAMKAQSAELGQIIVGDRDRIRSALAESRASLRFNDECGAATATTEESFKPCTVRAFVSAQAGSRDIEKVINISSIIELQDALAAYGENLALLAESASADNKKFAEAATGLATSVGKLDGAISKLAVSAPNVGAAKLGIVANAIAKIAGLAFAIQREHALKEIIRDTDPFVQKAIGLLDQADRQNVQILASQATRNADTLLEVYNSAAAQQTSSTAERQAAINAVFESIDGVNILAQRQSQTLPLGRLHAALASAAARGASHRQLTEAIEQLIRWNSNQGISSQPIGDK